MPGTITKCFAIFPLTGRCSEGLDAFRFFFKNHHYYCPIVFFGWSGLPLGWFLESSVHVTVGSHTRPTLLVRVSRRRRRVRIIGRPPLSHFSSLVFRSEPPFNLPNVWQIGNRTVSRVSPADRPPNLEFERPPPHCSFGENKENHASHLQALRRSRSASRPYKDTFGSSTMATVISRPRARARFLLSRCRRRRRALLCLAASVCARGIFPYL